MDLSGNSIIESDDGPDDQGGNEIVTVVVRDVHLGCVEKRGSMDNCSLFFCPSKNFHLCTN